MLGTSNFSTTIHPILHYTHHTHHHELVVLRSLLPQWVQLAQLQHPPWRIGDCDVGDFHYLVMVLPTFLIIVIVIMHDGASMMIVQPW